MLNYVVMTGRLTADPELRHTDSQVPVTSFSIANQGNYKPADADDYPVDFFNAVAWRKTAEFISNYFSKGSLITIEGELKNRRYTDKNGNNRISTEILVKQAHFGESKRNSNNESAAPDDVDPFSSGFAPEFPAGNESDDDLPF